MKRGYFIVISLVFLILCNIVLADLIPPECMKGNPPNYCKYGNYKGQLYLTSYFFNPGFALFVNFVSIFIITLFLGYFYLRYKNFKLILLGSLVASIIGAVIDSVSLFLSSAIHDILFSTYLFDTNLLKIIFIVSIFVISFLLLGIMYLLITLKLLKIKFDKRVIFSSIILAILSNPVWFML